MKLDFTRLAEWPEIRKGRYAAMFQQGKVAGCRVAFVGLPDDTGVRLNGGRPGAHAGPSAFRAALARFGTSYDGLSRRQLPTPIFDAGDVIPAPGDSETALSETHARVRSVVGALHERDLTVIAIGGGHDLSFPSIGALSESLGSALGGVNFDAHLDVRERVGSGMAFRSLINAKHLDPKRFCEIGLGRYSNDENDLEWLAAQGSTLIFADEVHQQPEAVDACLRPALAGGPGFVSIDLDALDQSLAPGVSAPNPCGLGVHEAARLAEAAGRSTLVRHFDVMELCPAFDVDGHTARVAALLVLSFLTGFAERAE